MTANYNPRRLAAGIGLAVVLGLSGFAPALAGKTYDNRDLRGEYVYSLIEAERITQGDPPVQTILYCTSIGIAVADGAGTLLTTGTVRCNVDGTVIVEESVDDPVYYEVQPNGEVLFWDPESTEPTHGFIVDNGRTILIDGSLRSADWLYQHGHAVKK